MHFTYRGARFEVCQAIRRGLFDSGDRFSHLTGI